MRGILMIEPLFHQTTKGNKTQTRRSGGLEQVNGAPEVKKKGKVVKAAIIANPDDWHCFNELKNANLTSSKLFRNIKTGEHVTCKSRYKVGEVLFIKEPTKKINMEGGSAILYKYSAEGNPYSNSKWSNKLFMGVDRARAFIRITGIRCERLLDISGADCISEGIEYAEPFEGMMNNGEHWKNYDKKHHMVKGWLFEPKQSFFSLFRFANKVKEIENIWVWAYDLEYLPNYKLNDPA